MSGQEREKPQEDTEWGAGRRRGGGEEEERGRAKRESKEGKEKGRGERRRREGKETREGGNLLMYSTAYISYVRNGYGF